MNVLITGSTGKIGEALALEFSGAKMRLALHYGRNFKKASSIAALIEKNGGEAFPVGANLLDETACRSLVSCASKMLGGLDAIVHLAGAFGPTDFKKAVSEDLLDFFRINAMSSFFIAQTAALEMKKSGSLVFMSDVAGQLTYKKFIPYCMSKAALDSLVRGLALELAPKIRVNAIAPYFVSAKGPKGKLPTEILNNIPAGRPQSPSDIARLALYLCQSKSMTGQVLTVDGGRTLK